MYLKEAPILQYLTTKIPYYSELNNLIISLLNTLLLTCLVDESQAIVCTISLHKIVCFKQWRTQYNYFGILCQKGIYKHCQK